MKYRTIVADPPWPYGGRMSGTLHGRNSAKPKLSMRLAPLPYSTMSLEAIGALPVASMAALDAHMYLWTTQRFLRDGFDILDAWGFTFSAVLVWSKPPKGVVGTFVSSTEFCLFARRGSLAHKNRHIGTCFTWPRGLHSAKPEAFLDIVERVSPGPYLEMFARRQRLGWDTWGNEALNHVDIGSPDAEP